MNLGAWHDADNEAEESEGLHFANVRHLEDLVTAGGTRDPPRRDLVLACQAIDVIDAMALASLEALNRHLRDQHLGLHLADMKGPVLDRLRRAELLETLNGRGFLSAFGAWRELHGRGLAPLSHPRIDHRYLTIR